MGGESATLKERERECHTQGERERVEGNGVILMGLGSRA
jgi:hypothetical protein